VRIALDTNILAYAEGTNGKSMQQKALQILERLPPADVVIPVQALGELFNVLVRKAGRKPARARTAVLSWHDAYLVADTSASIMSAAMDLACDHGLSVWDAVILSAAADAGCRLVLSEDLQDGFTWRGVTIANPFAAVMHPLLGAALLP
jgi:predicted nucleic acid-binding protein